MHLEQWFLTEGARLSRGASMDFKGGASPYALCNTESLIKKLTNEYIYLNNLFIVRGLDTKDNYSKGAWQKEG